MKPILVSFSGGRTSAFMARFMKEFPKYSKQKLIFAFANTGKEKEETLQFIHECDTRWNLGVVWLEAVVSPDKGEGTSFKVVTFETASRSGEPFEAVIQKYGIPNKNFPHCTRELKQKPIKKYLQSLGYKDWFTAVGIRADEPTRINRKGYGDFNNPIYPLADDIQVDEPFIRSWWNKQQFDLQLKDYQGNCDLCYKKSLRKRLTLIAENPSMPVWWNQMEKKYGKGKYLFDQRQGISIEEQIELAKKPFRKAVDKHELSQMQGSLFEQDMDVEFTCFCQAT